MSSASPIQKKKKRGPAPSSCRYRIFVSVRLVARPESPSREMRGYIGWGMSDRASSDSRCQSLTARYFPHLGHVRCNRAQRPHMGDDPTKARSSRRTPCAVGERGHDHRGKRQRQQRRRAQRREAVTARRVLGEPEGIGAFSPRRSQPNKPAHRDRAAWLGMSDSNSEMSRQIIPLKAHADSQDPSRIPARETTRV
jgi:hypothetical protein